MGMIGCKILPDLPRGRGHGPRFSRRASGNLIFAEIVVFLKLTLRPVGSPMLKSRVEDFPDVALVNQAAHLPALGVRPMPCFNGRATSLTIAACALVSTSPYSLRSFSSSERVSSSSSGPRLLIAASLTRISDARIASFCAVVIVHSPMVEPIPTIVFSYITMWYFNLNLSTRNVKKLESIYRNLETKSVPGSALLGRRSPMMRNMTRPAKYPGVLIIQGRAAMLELVGMVQFQTPSLAQSSQRQPRSSSTLRRNRANAHAPASRWKPAHMVFSHGAIDISRQFPLQYLLVVLPTLAWGRINKRQTL